MFRNKKTAAALAAGAVVLLATAVFFFIRARQNIQGYESATAVMDGYVQQTVYGNNRESAATAAAEGVARLESRISWQTEGSDAARLNEAAGTDWITVDPQTAALLQTCLDAAEKSGGAFDPTILPLSSLWDFGGGNQHLPQKNQVLKFLPYVNYRNLRVNTADSTASLKLHSTAIDLNGVEKGAACDAAVQEYRKAGITGAIVAVGGSVGIYGQKPDRTLWQVAVRSPATAGGPQETVGQADLDSGFLSTCGIDQTSFAKGGVLYHHILDPRTGYPAENELVSVTVRSGSGALSDALSYACFVLGTEKGKSLLNQYHADGIFISRTKNVTVTGTLKSRFRITDRSYSLVK
jgi:thiamine biosynthesis lipoprotein